MRYISAVVIIAALTLFAAKSVFDTWFADNSPAEQVVKARALYEDIEQRRAAYRKEIAILLDGYEHKIGEPMYRRVDEMYGKHTDNSSIEGVYILDQGSASKP